MDYTIVAKAWWSMLKSEEPRIEVEATIHIPGEETEDVWNNLNLRSKAQVTMHNFMLERYREYRKAMTMPTGSTVLHIRPATEAEAATPEGA